MDVRAAYDSWAVSYDSDRNLTRDLDQRVTRQVLADVPATSILELGCGTGKNTAFLAERGVPLRALDFSAAMLAQAQAKVRRDNVTFSQADLTAPWPCADASADLIVGNLVLEHIEALPFIFAEAARCCRPGGHLFIAELHPFKQYLGSQARFEREQGVTMIPAFTHHLSDFLTAARVAGFTLLELEEWWHDDDQDAPPRLVSFLWRR